MVKPEIERSRNGDELHPVIDLTRSLVALDSQNPGSGETAMADFLEDLCRQRGFTVERIEYAPGRPNLLVTADCGAGPAFGLSGHLDTKPVGQEAERLWATDPFKLTVDHGRAYGLGAVDMKGAIAAMLLALERFAHIATRGCATIVLTADEEQGSEHGAKALAADGKLALDALLVGEPSGIEHSWEALHVVSRGICCFRVHVTTRQGHSGLSPRLGRNAIQLLGDIMQALERDLRLPTQAIDGTITSEPTVNAAIRVEGGVTFGTWPGHATLDAEIRTVPGLDRDEVTATIQEQVVRTVGTSGQAEVEFLEGSLGWMSSVAIASDHPVIGAAQRACSQVLGHRLPLAVYPGGTDATYFISRAGIPTITSLGPGRLIEAHGPNEWVRVDDLITAVDLYEATLAEFAALPSGDRQTGIHEH